MDAIILKLAATNTTSKNNETGTLLQNIEDILSKAKISVEITTDKSCNHTTHTIHADSLATAPTQFWHILAGILRTNTKTHKNMYATSHQTYADKIKEALQQADHQHA